VVEEHRNCHGLSEARLAALALEGCSPAWDELVRRHSHRVRLALLARGLGWDQAHDLMQEAWLRLVRQQRAGRLRSLVLPGLAIAQADWLAREEGRTRRRRESILSRPAAKAALTPGDVDHAAAEDPEQGAIRSERLELIRRELASCPPRAQQVFRAVYGPGGRSHAEVARDLGISVQRVRQTVCEVRARVRAALRDSAGGGKPWSI